MKNEIFTSLERPLVYLHFDIILWYFHFWFKNNRQYINENFVKVGLAQFLKI
jgi:hypothetical protein